MATERTLSIIKPDAVEKNHIGGIIALIEASGLKVKAMKMLHLSRPQAQGFYAVHKARPFFAEHLAVPHNHVVVCKHVRRSQPIVHRGFREKL